MTIRFLADENLVDGIIQGLRLREPAIDILDIKSTGLRGTEDPDLLEIAARQDRILISHDRATMPRYFAERLAVGLWNNPGLFIVPQEGAIGPVIDYLLLVWAASSPEEWRDRIVFIPAP